MHSPKIIVWIFGALTLLTGHVLCTGSTAQPLTCSSSQETCSDGSQCVLRQWICDGEQDCPDGSDEEDCARCLPSRWMCADRRRCIPEDWRCDRQADCMDGSDEGTCAFDVYVIIADYSGNIHKINASNGEDVIVYSDSFGPESVAYDRKAKHIYWSNTKAQQSIHRVKLDGEDHIKVTDVEKCKGLVVDGASRLLFYTAERAMLIHKLDLVTNQSTVIIRSYRTYKPHDITADLKTKKLYWTVVGETPGIEMSDYNGRDRLTLMTGGSFPTALALDSTGTTLLWLDEQRQKSHVMALDLATRSSRSLWHADTGNFIDIAILNTTLYLIDMYQRSAYVTLPETGGTPTTNSISERHRSRIRHISVISVGSLSPCSHN